MVKTHTAFHQRRQRPTRIGKVQDLEFFCQCRDLWALPPIGAGRACPSLHECLGYFAGQCLCQGVLRVWSRVVVVTTIDLRMSVSILVSNGEVHAQVFTLAQACSVSAHACSALAMDLHAKKAMGTPPCFLGLNGRSPVA